MDVSILYSNIMPLLIIVYSTIYYVLETDVVLSIH